jgi:O-acetylserine/cysteine efflux transporter
MSPPPPKPSPLPITHAALALAVVAIWGTNFVPIRIGLDHLQPLLFATLRFAFAAVPAIFFVRRPPVPWRHLAAYGLLIGPGQFGLMFLAMDGHISPGLASLVIQTQVLFTIGLSIAINGERVSLIEWLSVALAAIGLAVIVVHTDGGTTPLGLVLVVLAALSWSLGNIVARASGRVDMLAYMVWASLFGVPPLLALSLAVEGPSAIARGLGQADAATWAVVLWQAVGNMLFGYACWAWLFARHPAATIMPMALLVPVFGMGASAWWLGEPLPAWKLAAAAFVLGGLALNLLWPLLRQREGKV